MTSCPYCLRPATATIVANPSRVCPAHAAEFWTGLLNYSRTRHEPSARDEQVGAWDEKYASLSASAISSVGPSPGGQAGREMSLARTG